LSEVAGVNMDMEDSECIHYDPFQSGKKVSGSGRTAVQSLSRVDMERRRRKYG
jgi:hypothetical protein